MTSTSSVEDGDGLGPYLGALDAKLRSIEKVTAGKLQRAAAKKRCEHGCPHLFIVDESLVNKGRWARGFEAGGFQPLEETQSDGSRGS